MQLSRIRHKTKPSVSDRGSPCNLTTYIHTDDLDRFLLFSLFVSFVTPVVYQSFNTQQQKQKEDCSALHMAQNGCMIKGMSCPETKPVMWIEKYVGRPDR